MKPRAPAATQPSIPGGSGAGSPVFRHGVASGDPAADGVVLWTRVSPADTASAEVSYALALDPLMSEVVHSGSVHAGPETDFTVNVDVAGLAPGTTYYYQFRAGSEDSPIGRTRTLPVGPLERLRLGVVSCSSLARGYFNAYRRLAERSDLACVVHLGDYIYEYPSDAHSDVRSHEPAHELITLDDYRTRHAQYKTDPDLQELHRQHPMIAIWDDHEFADNAWKDGAGNHDARTERAWQQRVTDALQAYYEWMPTRRPLGAQPRRHYRAFTFGNLARLLMLEERLVGRDRPGRYVPGTLIPSFTQTDEFADPGRQLLGAEQESWFFEQLRRNDVKWRLVGQGVMVSQLKLRSAWNGAGDSRYLNPDQWDGYDPARERFFAVLAGDRQHAPVDNVVVMSGDVHSSWASDLTRDPANPDAANGGYDPASGAGSLAVEFVTPSVTSYGLEGLPSVVERALAVNPQFKYGEGTKRGYLLLDVTHERVSGEWWHVDTVRRPGADERFAAAYQVRDSRNHLELGGQSTAMPDSPLPAP